MRAMYKKMTFLLFQEEEEEALETELFTNIGQNQVRNHGCVQYDDTDNDDYDYGNNDDDDDPGEL